MTLFDVARMAFHNLWSRKLRTLLNILGVVLACVVLTMTLAGSRGVSAGFQKIISESEDVRKFMIYRAWKQQDDVPEEATRIDGKVNVNRRARLQERLKEMWLAANSTRVLLNAESLKQINSLPHIISVTPKVDLRCTVTLDDVTENASVAIVPRDMRAPDRIVAGEDLKESDHQGILLSEFGAYRLGHVSDDDVHDLIGRQIEVSVQLSGEKMTQWLAMAGSSDLPLASQAETMFAVKSLVDNVDSTPLTANEKELVRSLFSKANSKPAEPLFLKEKFTVRGITHEMTGDDMLGLLRVASMDTQSDVYMTAERASQIQMGKEGFATFRAAIGEVDDVSNLGAATEQIKSLGYDVYSSNRILKRIDEEIDRARLAVAVLSLLILTISAIGISNTMVVSVLERTSEFGILKAMGTPDRSVLQLMLMEGALTGLIGALVAIATSFALSKLAAIIVRKYVSGKIGGQFDASVFAFSSLDVILVVSVAVFVCTLAAVLPAYRAARLDPVVAMRRN